jgi:hypothetical protein
MLAEQANSSSLGGGAGEVGAVASGAVNTAEKAGGEAIKTVENVGGDAIDGLKSAAIDFFRGMKL